jgi:glycosyltransferase involved in cell wall biosynthesis
MTSYNRPERIGATLRSLSQQTLQPDEIIIADDLSPNDPTEEVERHRHLFAQPFNYLRREKNLGMPGNLNDLLARTKGDIIVNVHDADEFAPNYLEQLVTAIEQDERIGMAFTGWTFTDAPERRHLPDIPAVTPGRTFFRRYLMRSLSCPIWGTVALRRSVYLAHGPLDSQFGPLADVDYWARVCLTHDIAFIREPLLILYPVGTHGNEWRWSRFDWGRQINAANIRRHLQAEPGSLRWELVRHWFRYLGEYCFGMMHLIRRARWSRVFEGLAMLPAVLFRSG